jgi:hypothetical protein
MAIGFLQQSAFQYRFGQLLDEQRYAVGASENLVRHLLWQFLATGHSLHQSRAGAPVETREGDRDRMRVTRPGRRKFRPGREEQQHPKPRHVLDHGGEQLQRGRIDPVDILENRENGLSRRRPSS